MATKDIEVKATEVNATEVNATEVNATEANANATNANKAAKTSGGAKWSERCRQQREHNFQLAQKKCV